MRSTRSTRVVLPLCGLVLASGQLAALRGQSLYFDVNGNELSGNGIEGGQTYEWSGSAAYWSASSGGTSSTANTGWQSGATAEFSAAGSAPAFSVSVDAAGLNVGGIRTSGSLTIATGAGSLSTSATLFRAEVAPVATLTWEDGLASAPANFVFEKTGAGTLALGGLAPTTTALRLSAGTVRLTRDDALATTAPLRVEGNARLELAGTTQSIGTLAATGSGGTNIVDLGGGALTAREWASGIVNLGSGGVFTVSDPAANPGTNRTLLSGRTEGSGTFVKDDASTLVLGTSAGLAHSGDVEVRGGTLAISTTGYGIAQDYAISSGATLSLRSQLSGTSGGTGHALTKSITGAGTLELGNLSVYGGSSLRLAAGGSLGEDLNLRIGSNDFLNLDGRAASVATINSVSAGGYATVRLPTTSALTLGDGASAIAVIGPGSVTKDGTGIAAVRWSNAESTPGSANNFSGSLHAASGTLRLSETSPGTYSNYITAVGLARPSVTVAAGATLESQGAWITRLTGAGDTTLASGTLTVGSGTLSATGSAPAPTVAAFTYDGVISGYGGLTKTGSSDWTLTGAHTFTGTTRIDHGRLILGDGGNTGSLAGSIQLGGTNNAYYASALYPSDTPTLVLNRSGAYTFGNAVYVNSGGYGSIVNQTGDVTLTGVKQAAINVAGGNVTFGSSLGQPILGYVASGAGADIGGYAVQSYRFVNQGTIATGSGSTLQIYSGVDLSTPSTGSITGSGAIIKKDRGHAELTTNPLGILRNTVELGGVSTYSGGTTLEGGTLRALSATAFGTGTILVTRVNPATGSANWQKSTLDLNGQAVANRIDYGAGAIRNAANFAGLLDIRTTADITGDIGGTVHMGSGGSLDLAGRTIRATFINNPDGSSLVTNGSIALAGGRVEVATSSRQNPYNGNLTGSGTLVKTDTGLAESATPGASWVNTLDLAGSRSYSGTTRVEGGTLIVRNAGAAGSSQIHMEQTAPAGGFAEGRSARTVVVDLSNAAVANAIDYRSGVLRGVENHTGAIAVRTAAVFENSTRVGNGSGTITVFSGGSLPAQTYNKTVVLNSGGGLLGGGSIQSLTVNSGGYIDFTDGVATSLTVRSSLALGVGRTLSLDLDGLFHDSLTVQGTFTAGGLLDLQLVSDAAFVGGEEFHLITAQSFAGAFDEIRLPTLGTGLSWDTSRLAAAGVLSVSAIPEPATAAGLLGLAALGLASFRRRHRS